MFDIKTKDGDNSEFKGEASLGPVTGNLVMETPIVKGKSSLLFGARGLCQLDFKIYERTILE